MNGCRKQGKNRDIKEETKTGRSCGGLGVLGPAARGRCGGRAGCPDPLQGASSQPYLQADTRGAGRGGPDAPGTRDASSGASGRRPRRRQVRPSHLWPLVSAASSCLTARRRWTCQCGAEPQTCLWGPAAGQYPRGARRPLLSAPWAPFHSTVPLGGPAAAPFLGYFPPWVSSLPHLRSISHPLRGLPPPGAPRGWLATRGKSLAGTPGRETTRRSW